MPNFCHCLCCLPAQLRTCFYGKIPDLDPNKVLWAYVEGKRAGHMFSNVEELWKAVKLVEENLEVLHTDKIGWNK